MIARPLVALVRMPSGSVCVIFLSAAISTPTNKSSSSRLKTLHISQHGPKVEPFVEPSNYVRSWENDGGAAAVGDGGMGGCGLTNEYPGGFALSLSWWWWWGGTESMMGAKDVGALLCDTLLHL